MARAYDVFSLLWLMGMLHIGGFWFKLDIYIPYENIACN
jgi:hypothetical protein